MDIEVENVINNIRKLRIEKKISIVKLSVESGISRSHLYYIETKQTSPTLDTLSKIAKVLGVNMKDFFEFERDISTPEPFSYNTRGMTKNILVAENEFPNDDGENSFYKVEKHK